MLVLKNTPMLLGRLPGIWRLYRKEIRHVSSLAAKPSA